MEEKKKNVGKKKERKMKKRKKVASVSGIDCKLSSKGKKEDLQTPYIIYPDEKQK